MTESEEYDTEIRRAYAQTDFEMVETGANLEVPSSKAACYRIDDAVTPSDLQVALEREEFTFIAPYKKSGYLSSKLLDGVTNEFLHIKLNGDLLRVFPKDEEFSIATLERVVETVVKRFGEVELEVQDDA